ncbi:hypothetical protein D3C73_1366030 [compost metagenome]
MRRVANPEPVKVREALKEPVRTLGQGPAREKALVMDLEPAAVADQARVKARVKPRVKVRAKAKDREPAQDWAAGEELW